MATITSTHNYNPGARAIDETREVLMSDIGHQGNVNLAGGQNLPWQVTFTNVPAKHVTFVLGLVEEWEPSAVSIDYEN